tara:strand:+ start:163 stop:348 length:186 start_codon:yes stop_codon:yes gene_type:complete
MLVSAKVDENNAALMTMDNLEYFDDVDNLNNFFILKSSPTFIIIAIKKLTAVQLTSIQTTK